MIVTEMIARTMFNVHKSFFRIFSKYEYEFYYDDYKKNISGFRTVEELQRMIINAMELMADANAEFTWDHLKECDYHFERFVNVCEAFVDALQGENFIKCLHDRMMKFYGDLSATSDVINTAEEYMTELNQVSLWQDPNSN